ncbi:MAG: intermembrane phospholipid transport protein YdbH family protein [Planctomycetota bacterium]
MQTETGISKLKIAAAAFVLLAAGLIFLLTSSIPQKILSDTISDKLSALGINNLKFKLTELNLDGLILKNISAGNNEDVKISRLTCSWSINSLLNSNLENITAENAECLLTVRNGKVLNNIFTDQGGQGNSELPFKSLTVKKLQLTADIDKVIKKQAVSLTFTKQKDRSLSFSYNTSGGFGNGEGSGTLDNSLNNLQAEASLNLTQKHKTGKLLGIGPTFLFSGNITGKISFNIRDFDSLQAELLFKDSSVKDDSYDFNLTGLSGKTTLSGFTNPEADFTFKNLSLGTLNFNNGKFAAQLKDDKLFFKKAEVELFKGNISAENFYVDPEKYSTSCEIKCRNLSLEEVLLWALEGKLTGKGNVSGKLFVEIPEWPLLSLEPGGYLAAGGKEQILQLNDTKMVKDLITANQADLQETGNLLVEALQSFHYDELRLDIIEKDKLRTGRLFLRGRGLTGIKQPVGGLTINILAFRKTLMTLILSNELYVKWQDKIENMTNIK